MRQLGGRAVVEDGVGGQVLAEVGHPAGEAEVDEVPPDDALVPVEGRRVREVDDARVELAEVHEVVLARGVLGEEAPARGLVEEAPARGDVGVDVAEEADALGRAGARWSPSRPG